MAINSPKIPNPKMAAARAFVRSLNILLKFVRLYGLEHKRSTSVTAVLLGALDAVLAQWRLDPTEKSGIILEETYLAMVVGAYSVESADLSECAATAGRGGTDD